MLRRPSAPRARRFLKKIVKGVTRALGLGVKTPSISVQVDTGGAQLAQQEAARAAAQATQAAQERLAQERAASRARAVTSVLEDDEFDQEDLTRRRRGTVL